MTPTHVHLIVRMQYQTQAPPQLRQVLHVSLDRTWARDRCYELNEAETEEGFFCTIWTRQLDGA